MYSASQGVGFVFQFVRWSVPPRATADMLEMKSFFENFYFIIFYFELAVFWGDLLQFLARTPPSTQYTTETDSL